MGTYPRDRQEFLNWCEAHQPVWEANAAAIGLVAAQTTLFKNGTTTMRGKVTAQTTAKAVAKAATEAVVDAESVLRSTASDLIRAIRSFAENNNNPNVYTIAQIPPPQAGSPVPPPGQPNEFKVELNPSGSITIKWKAKHPEGSDRVVYFVQRKLAAEVNFSLLGGTGEKKYEDDSLPSGSEGATYIVTAQRGQVSGAPSQQLTVTFGVGGPGFMISSVTAGSQKLAA